MKIFQQLGRIFFCRSSSRIKHNWHCIMLLNVYFILHYRLFFRKEIYFFECFYFNVYDAQVSLYVFCLIKGPIQYVCNWSGMGESSKMHTIAYRERGCDPSCVRTHVHYLFLCLLQHFCRIVSCFICRSLTYLYSNRMRSSETVTFLQQNWFRSSWNELFLLKTIFANQS